MRFKTLEEKIAYKEGLGVAHEALWHISRILRDDKLISKNGMAETGARLAISLINTQLRALLDAAE